MTSALPTGIEILDRKMDGGIPPGRLVVVSAAPASQSEALLYELATARSSLYVTTMRPSAQIEAILADASTGDTDHRVVEVDGERALGVVNLVERLPEHSHVVIDPMEPLEAQDADAFREFLVDLRDVLEATRSVAYLHCLTGVDASPRRDVTAYMADVVFDVTTQRHGDSMETHLSVPKFRRGRAPEDVVKLDLSTGVSVDFSRNIV